ncbi:uncharacterized protein LOC141911525 [Tubulanus polymorphus]|uniref:uncharacterized protein LOC141911525 n=1 Tax=Tubulanus polymorphus TaxID=672921 RepID=UPI003DA1E4AA
MSYISKASMYTTRRILVRLIFLANFIIFNAALVTARGGRGGGSRGGGYRGGSRGGTSSTGTGSRAYRAAIVGGTIYGSAAFMRRGRYSSNSADPTVCTNFKIVENITRFPLGRFICPISDSMSDDYTYCCGNDGEQTCCTFWDDGGRTAGAIIGFVLLGVCIAGGIVILYKLMIKNKKTSPSTTPAGDTPMNAHRTHQYDNWSKYPSNTDQVDFYPPQSAHPVQPFYPVTNTMKMEPPPYSAGPTRY